MTNRFSQRKKSLYAPILIVCLLFQSFFVMSVGAEPVQSVSGADALQLEQSSEGVLPEEAAGDMTVRESSVSGNAGEQQRPSVSDNTQDTSNTGKILLVGNSFTRNGEIGSGCSLQEQLECIARSAQNPVEIETVAHGAAKLSYYAGISSKHESYYKELVEALQREDWDYMIFQEQSTNPLFNYESETYPAAVELQRIVRQIRPNAKVFLYMTHGYTYRYIHAGEAFTLNANDMERQVGAVYARLGKQLGVEVIPAGMQFYRAMLAYPQISLYSMDAKHPSPLGYYMGACSIFQKIYGFLPAVQSSDLPAVSVSQRQLDGLMALTEDTIASDITLESMLIGDTVAMQAYNTGGRAISGLRYMSLNPEVASVNAKTGVIKALSGGTAGIVAETQDGQQAFCTVLVTKPLAFGRQFYLAGNQETIRIMPVGSASTLRWRSGNKAVATVDEEGVVTTKRGGRTVIVVTNKEDPDDTARYTLYVSCAAPQNVRAQLAKKQQRGKTVNLRVTWNKVQGATQYKVYRANSKKGAYKLLGTTTRTYYLEQGKKQGQFWYYKIMAVNGNAYCDSDFSEVCRGGTPALKDLKVRAAGKKAVKLTWKKNGSAAGYVIYRSTSQNGSYKKLAVITSKRQNYYVDKARKKGKSYYYKVIAYSKKASRSI